MVVCPTPSISSISLRVIRGLFLIIAIIIHVHETARECPTNFERWSPPLNKQHLWLYLLCYYNTVSRNSRSWIIICVYHNFNFLFYLLLFSILFLYKPLSAINVLRGFLFTWNYNSHQQVSIF